jgi:hypothetical protein
VPPETRKGAQVKSASREVYPRSNALAREVVVLDLSDPQEEARARRLCREHRGLVEVMALDANRVALAVHKNAERRRS